MRALHKTCRAYPASSVWIGQKTRHAAPVALFRLGFRYDSATCFSAASALCEAPTGTLSPIAVDGGVEHCIERVEAERLRVQLYCIVALACIPRRPMRYLIRPLSKLHFHHAPPVKKESLPKLWPPACDNRCTQPPEVTQAKLFCFMSHSCDPSPEHRASLAAAALTPRRRQSLRRLDLQEPASKRPSQRGI